MPSIRNFITTVFCLAALFACADVPSSKPSDPISTSESSSVQLGPRPYYLLNALPEGELKSRLQSCQNGPFYHSDFSIGHRGAPLQFPEHTKESYLAAHRMGAGILECDVTFTNDHELVCRHSQCDLHTTTNILETELAAKCTQPFQAADPIAGTPASAKCCTSDISVSEFLSLKGKMDAYNPNARTVKEYLQGTANWRTDLYQQRGTLLTHAQSIKLFKSLGAKMTPELKTPMVEMPFNGFTQQDYASKLLAEYTLAGVPSDHVWPQSFRLADVEYWIQKHSKFAEQAVYLDGRYKSARFDINVPESWQPSMNELYDSGVRVLASPLWMLVDNQGGRIVASTYAQQAKQAGLQLIAWTLERSGDLTDGGGWYYQSIRELTTSDAVTFELLEVLARDVGVIGVFSDWPATTSYYANCAGYK